MAQIEARSAATGRVRLVPEHWLERFPEKWSATEAALEAEVEVGPPDESWTIAEMRGWAEPRGVDLAGLRSHADILAAVTAAGSTHDNGANGAEGQE